MTSINSFLEGKKDAISNYFNALVNFQCNPQTAHGNIQVTELSVYDLHLLHSLVFQYQESIMPLFPDNESAAGFQKLLDKVGSYQSKVSFSFLEEAHQKFVKQTLEHFKEEASFIGYVDVKKKDQKKGKKQKKERRILIVCLLYTSPSPRDS
eukprot:TRINITY_DN6535_c0_g2_i2.p1 TRINITY_DN6535_c0_g2~~TRINITY_DN6535_c0_g2_i2.p1  ORF type:complete len:152 (+),score=28.61 TRINITY_DN6535_c0_g2_i2:362-817(+)